GGNDCAANILNAAYPKLFLQSSSQWDTDDWNPAPPESIDYGDGPLIVSEGGLWRGCHAETVWAAVPPGTNPGHATVTIEISCPWTQGPSTTCTPSDYKVFSCVRNDQGGAISWVIQR